MKTFLAILFPLVALGIFGASFWYVAFRLRTLLDLSTRWPLRIGIAVVVVAAMISMLSAAGSSSPAVGILNMVGGYVFTFYVFLLMLLSITHLLQLVWEPARTWLAGSVLGLPAILLLLSALLAQSFDVHEAEIPLPLLSLPCSLLLYAVSAHAVKAALPSQEAGIGQRPDSYLRHRTWGAIHPP